VEEAEEEEEEADTSNIPPLFKSNKKFANVDDEPSLKKKSELKGNKLNICTPHTGTIKNATFLPSSSLV